MTAVLSAGIDRCSVQRPFFMLHAAAAVVRLPQYG